MTTINRVVTFVGKKVVEVRTSEAFGAVGNSITMGGDYKDVHLKIIKSYICFV